MEDSRIGLVSTERQVGAAEEPTLQDIHAALVDVYGSDFGIHEPIWISRFTDMARQDAVNLGWKLAQVVKGISPDRLFDTYHAERHPVPINFGERDAFDGIAALWSDRVECVDAKYTGALELPVIGVIDAPAAVLVRPDGHVAWVDEGSDAGLADALTEWFGAPTTAT